MEENLKKRKFVAMECKDQRRSTGKSSGAYSQSVKNLIFFNREEVVRRLRFRGQPMTLFGEDDLMRLKRLNYVLNEEGQTNDLLRDIADAIGSMSKSSSSKTLTDQGNIENPPILTREEVIGRLRLFNQPVNLFGEDDQARLDRLLNIVQEALKEGQTNDFLLDIDRKMKNKIREEEEEEEERRSKEEEEEEETRRREEEGDLKLMNADFNDLCDEDKILVFFKSLLNEWKLHEEEEEPSELHSDNLNPLLNLCRNKDLPADICRDLMSVVNCCLRRDYTAARSQYFKLICENASRPK